MLLLLSAPAAMDYYLKTGMKIVSNGFMTQRKNSGISALKRNAQSGWFDPAKPSASAGFSQMKSRRHALSLSVSDPEREGPGLTETKAACPIFPKFRLPFKIQIR
ncbi:MAG: hypothetical protein ACTTKK_07965 [Ottowia sp.]